MSNLETAIERLTGKQAIPDDEAPIRIWGASNDYNARGHGVTEARRVLRNGTWQWFAPRASSGRLRASDRKDTQYGDVWLGELVAEYTLGKKNPEPDMFLVVYVGDDGETKRSVLKHTKRRDGQYSIVIPGVETPLVVADPAWR
jgi:hypothetical protein